MRRLTFLSRHPIILTVTLLLLAVPAWADNDEHARATLKGVEPIRVLVGPIGADAEQDGLITAQITTDVELRLWQSGIKVAPQSHFWLYVLINTAKQTAYPIYAYNASVRFQQPITVLRNPTKFICCGVTWSVGAIGAIGTVDVRRLRDVQSAVNELVDEFINAYLEQNPKR